MNLTKRQRENILPLLQQAVQAKIDQWDLERQIESVVDAELDSMQDGLEILAVNYNEGKDVRLEDVDDYIDRCREC